MGADLTKLVESERQKGSKEIDLSSRNLNEIPPQIVILRDVLEK
jgi:hypothetical protein